MDMRNDIIMMNYSLVALDDMKRKRGQSRTAPFIPLSDVRLPGMCGSHYLKNDEPRARWALHTSSLSSMPSPGLSGTVKYPPL